MNMKDHPLGILLEALRSGKAQVFEGDIPKDLSNFLGDFMKKTEKPIGKVTPDLLKRFKALAHEDRVMHREMEAVSNRLQAEYQRRLEEELDKRREQHDEILARKSAIWDEISEYLGQDREQPMNIDPITGVVSVVLEANDNLPKKKDHLRVVPFNKDSEDELH